MANGELIGHYSIIAPIGAGGMGKVYLARDMTLGRKVALKLLPVDFTHDTDRVRRFQQEARAASALNHPNIITIYEIGEIDDRHFIASEFIDGETLREHISGSQSRVAADRNSVAGAGIQLSEVVSIAMQLADALAAAHSKGIVHRDIKPENIMLVKDSHLMHKESFVKVLDFGIAKLTERGTSGKAREATTKLLLNTHEGSVIGTASYMSPEQARGEEVDARTDIWSLGIVLYEMLTNGVPFGGDTTQDVIASILKEEPPPVSVEVPDRLRWIVEKALRKNRDERYQTIREMFTDLRDIQSQEDELRVKRLPLASSESVPAKTGEAGSDHVAGPQLSLANVDARPTLSASEYLIGELRQHKRAAAILLATLFLAIGGAAYFFYFGKIGKARIASIAVLPFTNVSNNPDTEYLSDGVSESLINSLSQLPGVKVIARSSSFKYKGKDIDPQEVARALSVEGILTGRVTQRGDNLLISVELMDTRDKMQVWGEQYNRKSTDVLQVQADISREIAEKLRLRLTAGEQQQLTKRETVNPQAYELLLKGRFYWNKGGTENQKKGVEYYQQATALDPAYALAYAELSDSYVKLTGIGTLDPKEFTPKAEVAAYKALELDESLAEAHLALATIKQIAWDWAAAEREFKRAIELNPNLAKAHRSYSLYLSLTGLHEQGIAEAKRGTELDPLSLIANFSFGSRLLFARQNDQAIEVAKRMLELDQNHPMPHLLLGYAYAAKEQYPRAITAYQEGIRLGDGSPDTQILLGAAYAKAGELEKARAIHKRLEARKEYVSPGALAVLYVALGEREQAFASLGRAYAEHDLQLQFLRVDPNLDPLRSDPRFQDLLRRVGFSP